MVAALTIPTLINKVSEKAKLAQKEVIEDRLLDGLNRYSTMEDGFSKPYQTTEEFLQGLARHYKMTSICSFADLSQCFPEGTLNFVDNDNNPQSIAVSDITSMATLGLSEEEWLEPAGFITAQGTPFILSFKKGCTRDSGRAMRSITESGCIAYMYDTNGTRGPNKIGTDIASHGMSIALSSGPSCYATVGGVCLVGDAFEPPELTEAECQEEVAKNYGITQCLSGGNDRWAGAMKTCHDQGLRLPSLDEIIAIRRDLYNDSSITSYWAVDGTLDYSKLPASFISAYGESLSSGGGYDIWSSEEESDAVADALYFTESYSSIDNESDSGAYRGSTETLAVCVSD